MSGTIPLDNLVSCSLEFRLQLFQRSFNRRVHFYNTIVYEHAYS